MVSKEDKRLMALIMVISCAYLSAIFLAIALLWNLEKSILTLGFLVGAGIAVYSHQLHSALSGP